MSQSSPQSAAHQAALRAALAAVIIVLLGLAALCQEGTRHQVGTCLIEVGEYLTSVSPEAGEALAAFGKLLDSHAELDSEIAGLRSDLRLIDRDLHGCQANSPAEKRLLAGEGILLSRIAALEKTRAKIVNALKELAPKLGRGMTRSRSDVSDEEVRIATELIDRLDPDTQPDEATTGEEVLIRLGL